MRKLFKAFFTVFTVFLFLQVPAFAAISESAGPVRMTEQKQKELYEKYIAPITDYRTTDLFNIDESEEYNLDDRTLSQTGKDHDLAMWNYLREASGVAPITWDDEKV